MDDRKIRAEYGGKLPKAINRAIRAEIPGGNEALDKLTQLAGAARHSRWKDRAGRDTPEAAGDFKHQQDGVGRRRAGGDTPEAPPYFKRRQDVVGRMEADARRRWGIPPEQAAAKGKPRAKPAG